MAVLEAVIMKRNEAGVIIIAVMLTLLNVNLISCNSGGGRGGRSVTLRWNAPTSYTDGSPLNPISDLAIYRIYYGTSTHNYSQAISIVNPMTTTITYNLKLSSGKYYFAVSTVDTLGQESSLSSEVSKTID
jgi:hypothetical protein